MAKAVFIQNPESIYDDQPGEAYHFPKRYLGAVKKTVGDWVIFYEGRKGKFGYVSVQKVVGIEVDPNRTDHFYARLELKTEWQFETTVERADTSGQAYERSLRGADGTPTSGGANVSAVRALSDMEFAAIIDAGLTASPSTDGFPREGPLHSGIAGFSDVLTSFEPAPLSFDRTIVLTSRKKRDESFARMVKTAYGGRCAISGLALKNGGGRPEVQAAHIRPVERDGPDTIRNGLALSGTLHWMFDRGLISVAGDYQILVSHNKVSAEVANRLIAPEQKLLLPQNERDRPHPEYLRFHRENIFGQLE